MNKNLLAGILLLAICIGCKDNAYIPPLPSPADSYFPQTAGSTWKYRDSITFENKDVLNYHQVQIDTLSFKMTGGTTDFNGSICFNVVKTSKAKTSQTAYFYANKHLFALYELNNYGFAQFQMLNDTASAGYTWTNGPANNTPLTGNPERAITTIKEKNITKVIAGKTYTNVIHTSIYFQIYINGTWIQNIVFYDYYLAKGIGIIQKDTHVFNVLDETETILDYTIK